MVKMNTSCLLIALVAALPLAAQADVKVGIIFGETGPGASLGIPYKKATLIMPKMLGGVPAEYIVLDDHTDPTLTVKLARKLIEQDKVDLIIGSGSAPTAMAVAQVAQEMKTPQISLSPIPVTAQKYPWSFAVPMSPEIGMKAVVKDLKRRGLKKVAYLGYSDSWGELVLSGFNHNIKGSDITVVANEHYARTETSVTGQVLSDSCQARRHFVGWFRHGGCFALRATARARL